MKCGFTIEHYKECIELAKDKGYTISPLRNYLDYPKKRKLLLLRHDIDWGLEQAYDLANIEYDLGICSSYYVYMHSPTYSVLSPNSMEMIRQISMMMHEVGIHYDSRYSMSHETDILSKITKKAISSCSRHDPSNTQKETYQGIIDVNDIDMKYISDSGRNWREGCLCQWLGKKNRLHVLIHPEWWVYNTTSRDDGLSKIFKILNNSLIRNMQSIEQQLFKYCKDLGLTY